MLKRESCCAIVVSLSLSLQTTCRVSGLMLLWNHIELPFKTKLSSFRNILTRLVQTSMKVHLISGFWLLGKRLTTDITLSKNSIVRVYLQLTGKHQPGEFSFSPQQGKFFSPEGDFQRPRRLKAPIKKTNVVNIFWMTMSSISGCQKNQL